MAALTAATDRPSFSVPPTSASVPGCDSTAPHAPKGSPSEPSASRGNTACRTTKATGSATSTPRAATVAAARMNTLFMIARLLLHGYPTRIACKGVQNYDIRRCPSSGAARSRLCRAAAAPLGKRVALRGAQHLLAKDAGEAGEDLGARRAGRAWASGSNAKSLNKGAWPPRPGAPASARRPPRRAGLPRTRRSRRTCAPRRAGARS